MMGCRAAFAFLFIGLMTGPALAAAGDYDKSENTPLYTLRLRVPAAAMRIAPLKSTIMAGFDKDADDIKSGAADAKKDDPDSFHPFALDANWRVTFESPTVLSLSDEIYSDGGGAHPNENYEAIVWDKAGQRAVPIDALFVSGQSGAALQAIADFASNSWVKEYAKRSSSPVDPSMLDMAHDGIGPNVDKLHTYALTYAKGDSHANGIVLLYGAGEVWAHALGDFRVAVPASVFARYLTPQWRTVFAEP